MNLPFGTTSFNPPPVGADHPTQGSYMALIMFILMSFINSTAVVIVPHMLISELFPYK